MKTPTLLRFVCLVCAWTSTLAEEYVQVQRAPGVPAPGIKGCLRSPVASYTVRFQSLKTSGGSVYSRQLVSTAGLPCFENSSNKTTLVATTIANCAEATAKKGLNSFSWENGTCTAYIVWRPQKRADCKDGGSMVVYVVKNPLTPFGGGKIVVSGAISAGKVNIGHQYECGFSADVYKGYKLLINGKDVVMLPEGTATYNLNKKLLCFGSVNISLWSVGADGMVNSDEAQVAYAGAPGANYYGLTTGGCLYNAVRYGSYLETLSYCNSIDGTLFSENVDGEALAFLAAMQASAFPEGAAGFYAGIRWVAEGQWTWTGGLSQPSVDTIWAAPPAGPFECAYVAQSYGQWRFFALEDCISIVPIVCYFPNP